MAVDSLVICDSGSTIIARFLLLSEMVMVIGFGNLPDYNVEEFKWGYTEDVNFSILQMMHGVKGSSLL